MNGRNEFEVTTSTSRKPTSGPVARRAGVAGELSAVAGTTQRRGSVLVLVIGVLALLAIIVVVYTAIGQSDARTGRAIVTKTQNDDASRSVGNYIAQIIGDNATATYFTRPEATRQFMTVLQATDYPSTDPEARSVFRAGITQDRFRAVKFSPSGHQRHRWDDTAGNDPRISSDPWLASTEPTWINRTPATSTDTAASIPDLVMNMTDWAQMSIISPDGRVVNLANLRASLQAPSGFGTVGGLSAISEQLRQIKAPASIADRSGVLQLDASLASTTDEYNSPATWAIGPGLFRHVKDTGAIGPTGASPGSPDYLGNQFADADGDGFYDSRWQELVDASNPDEPVNILGSSGSLRLFVAPRIIDLSGLVNVNTATSFADPFSSRGQVPAGTTRGTVAIDPILPQASVLLGSVGADLETAFRGAPVRYRMTAASQPGVPPIRPLLGTLSELQSRRYFIEAAPGATPADVDLERLLTGFDAARYLGRSPEDYFGALRPNDPYGQLLAGPNPQELRAELGGAGFASLMTMRSLGVANSTDFAISGSLPTGIDNVTASGGALYPYFIPGALPFSPAHAERGIEDVISGVAIPPANLQPGLQRELFDERVVREAYRLYVTPEDRKAFYARATAGSNTFNQVTSSTTGPLGNSTDVDFSVAGLAGLSDERELRTFGGANDPRTQSSLETSVDFRLAQTAASPVGPMRSNRSLLDDRDRDVETAAGREARLAQYFTDPRRLMTTISGGRPLMATSERFVEPSGAANNATLADGATLSQRNVRLDVVSAIARALPDLQTNAAGTVNFVTNGSSSAANEIFINYAEALIPLADSQFDPAAGGGAAGFDLWSTQVNAAGRRTSATIFGSVYPDDRDVLPLTYVTDRRAAPRQNTELALRAAAHMTINLLAWRSPIDRPIAATLLLNNRIRPLANGTPVAGGVANLGSSNNGNARKIDGGDGEVVAYPFWTTGSTAIAGQNLLTFGLDFDDRAVRPGPVTDVRLFDAALPSSADQATPAAVNIFAVRPEPVVTQVQSYVVYVDADRTDGSEIIRNEDFATRDELLARLASDEDGDRNEAEIATNIRIGGVPQPEPDPDFVGKIRINGTVRADNPDFIMEMVAFQISNPTDTPIYLSGGQRKPPAFNPEGISGFRRLAQRQATGTTDGFIDPIVDPQTASGGDVIDETNFDDSYYIEFGGRYYRLADYSWDPTSTGPIDDDDQSTTGAASPAGRAVVLQPGQSRVFYVLGSSPRRIAARVNASGRATGGFASRNVIDWIYTQLWQKYTFRDLSVSPAREFVVRAGDGRENRPVRLLPFSPKTGSLPSPPLPGLGVLYPQAPGLPATETDFMDSPKSADNSTVRLWRAVRTNIGGAGVDETVRNRLGNDILVDRLTDPVVSIDNVDSSTPVLGSVERRLGMAKLVNRTFDDRRMGSPQRIEDTKGSLDNSGDNTGFSIVMTGGFRRPDDPSGWVDLDNAADAEFRGIGGGPTPSPDFGTSFPRGVIPSWAIETTFAQDITYSSGSLITAVDSTTRPWMIGVPSDSVRRSRNVSAFLLGHPGLEGGVGRLNGVGAPLRKEFFDDSAFAPRDLTDRQRRPAIAATKLSGDDGVFPRPGLRFQSAVQTASGFDFRSDEVDQAVVPEMSAHPSDKFRQAELVRRAVRNIGRDSSLIRPADDAVTLIDLARIGALTAAVQPTLSAPIPNRLRVLTVKNGGVLTDFSQKHTALPQFPRTAAAAAGQKSEAPIVPDLRPADMLLPLAIGPSQSPVDRDSDESRSEWTARTWETFGEAAGSALGYGVVENYNPSTANRGWRVDLGKVLDNGRLPIYTPAPFNDPLGNLALPNPVGASISGFTPTLDRGIPLAMAVLDRFRTLPQGGLNAPTTGIVNINTAPLSVLRMLPMMTSMDVNRRDTRTAAMHSWMTHGLTLSAFDSNSNREQIVTAGLDRVEQQNGPMNSAGIRRLEDDTNPALDPRSFLRNRADSVWDLAASVMAYRDKNAVTTMPSYDGRQRFVVDFAEGNDRSNPDLRSQFRFDDQARSYLTEIPGLREQPGFGSIGELLAVRIVDNAADANQRPGPAGVPPTLKQLRTENSLRGATNEQQLVYGTDLTVAGQFSVDRFGRDKQPADYAFQRRAEGPTGFVSTKTDPQIPLALTPLVNAEVLSAEYRDPGATNTSFVRPIDRLINRSVVPGTTVPIDPATMANLRPSSAVDSYEQKLIIANSLLNTVSVRSDIFCAYFVLHGYQQADLDGISAVAGDPGYDQPMVPTLKRRYMMVVDRSNVVKPGDKPKILMFQELPTE